MYVGKYITIPIWVFWDWKTARFKELFSSQPGFGWTHVRINWMNWGFNWWDYCSQLSLLGVKKPTPGNVVKWRDPWYPLNICGFRLWWGCWRRKVINHTPTAPGSTGCVKLLLVTTKTPHKSASKGHVLCSNRPTSHRFFSTTCQLSNWWVQLNEVLFRPKRLSGCSVKSYLSRSD